MLVCYVYNLGSVPMKIEVKGHSDDRLVCSAVSSVMEGAIQYFGGHIGSGSVKIASGDIKDKEAFELIATQLRLLEQTGEVQLIYKGVKVPRPPKKKIRMKKDANGKYL